ncbi:MerR family transcriptional regulator [Bacterioplanoides sp.]|uniref:MerR family transcriptional regulator n=1 Tax=Bacterioplanoides sp. TaxID=2066072 RepID=UPI003B5BE736
MPSDNDLHTMTIQRSFSGLYPIREFARLTGVNPATLRAWERRYGIVQPQRTDKGHRFYNDDDIKQVEHILYWLDQGYPIRQVKLLLNNDIKSGLDNSNDEWQVQQQQLLDGIKNLNLSLLDSLWSEGLANYPMAVYYQHCLMPVLFTLRQYSHLHQQVFIQQFKRKLLNYIQHQQKHNQGDVLLLVANHVDAELELLAVAYALGAASFHIEYFGYELTPADILQASEQLNCKKIWLHLSPGFQSDHQRWLSCINDSPQYRFFVSGTQASDTSPQHLHHLTGDFSERIKTYITANGAHSDTPSELPRGQQ